MRPNSGLSRLKISAHSCIPSVDENNYCIGIYVEIEKSSSLPLIRRPGKISQCSYRFSMFTYQISRND